MNRTMCVALLVALLACAPAVEAKKKHTAVVARIRARMVAGPAPAPMESTSLMNMMMGRSLLQDGAREEHCRQHHSSLRFVGQC
jgi:hypothetical protein